MSAGFETVLASSRAWSSTPEPVALRARDVQALAIIERFGATT